MGCALSASISLNRRRNWWPGTESNRRRQPFQGCVINDLQVPAFENTRLVRNRCGLHLDATGGLDSAWTPHRLYSWVPLALNLLLRARSYSPFQCCLTNVETALYAYIKDPHRRAEELINKKIPLHLLLDRQLNET